MASTGKGRSDREHYSKSRSKRLADCGRWRRRVPSSARPHVRLEVGGAGRDVTSPAGGYGRPRRRFVAVTGNKECNPRAASHYGGEKRAILGFWRKQREVSSFRRRSRSPRRSSESEKRDAAYLIVDDPPLTRYCPVVADSLIVIAARPNSIALRFEDSINEHRRGWGPLKSFPALSHMIGTISQLDVLNAIKTGAWPNPCI